jgi:lipopolysaccharide/colanic/teichoic acid biosynthesis glycosyltransferase
VTTGERVLVGEPGRGRGWSARWSRPSRRLRQLQRSQLRHYAVKRAVDVLGASALLLLFAPVMLAAYLAVRFTSPGGGLFRQHRIGALGRPFVLLKFRTMVENCAEDVHRTYVHRMMTGALEDPEDGVYKLDRDPRVTRVGALLRRTSIDELPQLLNVLRGDMSLVGPRPALAWEVELFPVWAASRFLVLPGLTGLWQVSGRNRLTMLDGLRLDVEYVGRCRLLTDLVILVRTPLALWRGGAR